ncbi:sigma-70 family RNA polymerase sigma factor [Flammeovirgaceae bacterium SG7u.111]|nr:sigma-70 family RNA polymerase sigma factor [Flammeovirgaceae bacterium SG7u.132]WPO35468.1 sigma-70 family RNA polymerase sigma factor [Flammeovirgaceae bacterium SG7u.111]
MKPTNRHLEEELKIIEKAKTNPAAFSDLYDRYYKDIFVFINRRTEDTELTADLVSQVFLKAMTNLNKYEFRGFPFSSWLYRVATNQVNEFFRKSNKQRTVYLEEHHVDNLMGEVEEHKDDKMHLLIKLLEQLNEDEVFLLELRFFEEKPFKEVAYILDITESNAKVKIYRILDKLRNIAKRNEA